MEVIRLAGTSGGVVALARRCRVINPLDVVALVIDLATVPVVVVVDVPARTVRVSTPSLDIRSVLHHGAQHGNHQYCHNEAERCNGADLRYAHILTAIDKRQVVLV